MVVRPKEKEILHWGQIKPSSKSCEIFLRVSCSDFSPIIIYNPFYHMWLKMCDKEVLKITIHTLPGIAIKVIRNSNGLFVICSGIIK